MFNIKIRNQVKGKNNYDLFYANCQSLLKNLDNIKYCVSCMRPLVMCFTETHITDEINDHEIEIAGYKLLTCKSHSRHTGGVAIYVDINNPVMDIQSKVLALNVWILTIKLNVHHSTFIIGVLYHSPSGSHADFLNYFEELMEDIIATNSKIIILGDFNIDLLTESTYSNKINNLISSLGLRQLINVPTRVTVDSSTLIDYLITNVNNVKYTVCDGLKVADHHSVLVSLNLKDKQNKIVRNVIKTRKRSFKNFDTLQFQLALIDTNWDNNSVDVDILASCLNYTVIDVLNEHAPFKEYRIFNNFKLNVWFSNEVIAKIIERDKLYKEAKNNNVIELWERYKLKRNEVTSLIRQETKNYFEIQIDQNKHDGKAMWKVLKGIVNGKKNFNNKSITFESIVLTDNNEIANAFNKFFINSLDNIVDSIVPLHDMNYVLNFMAETKTKFHKFEKIDLQGLSSIIGDIKKDTCDKDGITLKIIREAFEVIGNRFVDVINVSFQTGIFPNIWKLSTIIPIEKINNTSICSEFRPVNSLPIPEKLLELVAKNQLMKFIQKNDIIISEQSGFRKNHSCETSLQYVLNEWKMDISNNLIIGVVFLDFKRAFETVNRDLLILKLKKYGVEGTVLQWLTSYLENREQIVKFNDFYSEKMTIKHGIPQGSVLAPILFLLYINDISNYCKRCKLKLFADDTMLYVTGKVEDIESKLNEDLKNIYEWTCDNNLKLNLNKTKFMIVASKHNLKQLKLNKIKLNITINDFIIEEVTKFKYLGVIIDSELNFNAHCEYIKNKMAKKIGLLFRLSNKISMFAKLTIYKSMISPHIDYCGTTLIFLNKQQILTLQKVQNRGMRAILGCGRYAPINTMLSVLNLMNIEQRIIYNTLIFIFKMKYGMMPPYLTNKLNYVIDFHSYKTRATVNNDFYVKIEYVKSNTILGKGLIWFNDLPCEIKECRNMYIFKRLCTEYIKNTF